MAAAPSSDGGPSGGGGFGGGLAADGLADANGRGGGDGEGHHEGEAGAVEGDLVSREGESAHDADEEGDQAEDGDFDEDLAAGGCSEEREAAEARGFEVAGHAAETVVVAALDAPEGDDHEEGEIAARDGGREACTGDAEGGDVDGAEGVAVDEEPVADYVDEVRGDQGEGDGTDVVEGLQVAAEGEVEEEGGGAVVERARKATEPVRTAWSMGRRSMRNGAQTMMRMSVRARPAARMRPWRSQRLASSKRPAPWDWAR